MADHRRIKFAAFLFALSTVSHAQAALTPSEIFENVSGSVVVVHVMGPKHVRIGQGSGVVVAPDRVITNCHVAYAGKELRIQNADGSSSAIVVAQDRRHDLCLLAAKTRTSPPVSIQSNSDLRIGQKVIAIGSPQGLTNTLSDGLLSGLRDDEGTTLLQVTSPIAPGSSGGGLFNDNGDLIGVTSFKIAADGALNFAYPASLVRGLLADTVGANEFGEYKVILRISRNGPSFDTADRRIQYQVWQEEMSNRLKSTIANASIRLKLIEAVYYEAIRAGLDPGLVLGMIDVHSHFQPTYQADDGRIGYMGVPPLWTILVGDGDPSKLYDGRVNLRYGCSILRHYIEKENGNLFLALARYAGKTPSEALYPNQVLEAWKKYDFRPE